MISVVLSGGSGSRLWPVSRESYPKQFCEFFDRSFLRDTLERLRPFGGAEIVTLETMDTLTKNALAGLDAEKYPILLEPLSKNTAPAIALVVHRQLEQGHGDEVMGVYPADHLIANPNLFQDAIRLAETVVKRDGGVVTLGVKPSYAATGYGYMEIESSGVGNKGELAAYKVKNFFEKPNSAKAEEYAQSPHHFWNAGIFFFKVKTMADYMQKLMPEMWRKISTVKPDLSNLKYIYANIGAESLDYGIMEKLSDAVTCIPGDWGWSDVGSWDELARLQEEKVKIDSRATVFSHNATDNFVYSPEGKVVGLCGVEQLIVVDTPDALLVTKRGESQSVKMLVESMREARLPQAHEHIFEIRPWGRFEILSDRPDHKVKRLIVEPGQQLSYQLHLKRNEHWSIISGEAEVVMEGHVKHYRAGEQLLVSQGSKHRLRNAGRVPLVVIEVQTGSYFGEDDITRFEDDYKRV